MTGIYQTSRCGTKILMQIWANTPPSRSINLAYYCHTLSTSNLVCSEKKYAILILPRQ